MIISPPVNVSGSLIICIILSVIVSIQFRWSFTSANRQRENRYRSSLGFYTVFTSVLILLFVFFQIAGLLFPGFILHQFTDTAGLELCRLLIPLFVYYTLLFFLQPLFRKFFHPSFCAVCWTLPTVVYYAETAHPSPFEGMIILIGNATWMKAMGMIWLCGFLSVLICKVYKHLVFRNRLLRNSTVLRDGQIYEIYEKALKSSGSQQNYRLCICPILNTPLSIGITERSTVILLPDRSYTDLQLELIFTHELIHIQRKDPFTKFFMTLVNAAAWFIPFAWLTCAKAAQDLELSCDQAVIDECNEEQRREYAQLILSNAGNETGFTTCLSAKAKDLQYRLKGIMEPVRKSRGTVLIFLISFAILCSSGTVLPAQECGTVRDCIMEASADPDTFHITYVNSNGRPVSIQNERGLYEHIMRMELLKTSGRPVARNSSLADSDLITSIDLADGSDSFVIMMNGRSLRIWHAASDTGTYYVLKEPFSTQNLEQFTDN